MRIADTRLASLTAEAQAAQRKLDGLKDKFEAETKRLLAEQQTQLSVQRKPQTEELDTLSAQIDALKLQLDDLKAQAEIRKVELQGLDSDIAQKKGDFQAVVTKIESEEAALATLKADNGAETAQIAVRQATINQLVANKDSLEAELDALNQKRTELALISHKEQSEYDQFKAQREADIQQMNRKLTFLKTEAIKYEKDSLAERRALANWRLKLEEQEKNLKIREIKVNRDENTIRENANLLEL